MGISDDIIPIRKKTIHHSFAKATGPKTSEKTESEKSKERQDEELKKVEVRRSTDNGKEGKPAEKSKKEELRDTFFSSPAKSNSSGNHKNEQESKEGLPRRGFVIWAFIIMTSTLVGVLIYQNFAEIKSFLLENKSAEKNSASTTTSSTSYTGEIEPQDYTTGTSSKTTTPSDTSTTTPAATTTTLDKTAVLIQVLNGNGVSGAAEAAKKILVTDGFSVKSVTNARSFAYTASVIYYKTGKDVAAEAAKSALSVYQITLENSDIIAKTYDIVVVIGKK